MKIKDILKKIKFKTRERKSCYESIFEDHTMSEENVKDYDVKCCWIFDKKSCKAINTIFQYCYFDGFIWVYENDNYSAQEDQVFDTELEAREFGIQFLKDLKAEINEKIKEV